MAKGKPKKIPQRMCVSCREMKDKKELFRIVLQDGVPVLDLTGKLMGRGAYICKQTSCVDLAFAKGKQGKLSHHLKAPIPEGLEAEVRAALAKWEKEQARAGGTRKFQIGADGKVVRTGNGMQEGVGVGEQDE